jgi:hypothetical protein
MSVGGRIQGGLSKLKKKHFRVKHQKVKLFRASEPLLSVFMWGVNHTVRPFFAYRPSNRTPPQPPGATFGRRSGSVGAVPRFHTSGPTPLAKNIEESRTRCVIFITLPPRLCTVLVYLFWRFLFIYSRATSGSKKRSALYLGRSHRDEDFITAVRFLNCVFAKWVCLAHK